MEPIEREPPITYSDIAVLESSKAAASEDMSLSLSSESTEVPIAPFESGNSNSSLIESELFDDVRASDDPAPTPVDPFITFKIINQLSEEYAVSTGIVLTSEHQYLYECCGTSASFSSDYMNLVFVFKYSSYSFIYFLMELLSHPNPPLDLVGSASSLTCRVGTELDASDRRW